jgi:hypothetical protein
MWLGWGPVVSGGRQKISQKCKAVANSLSQLQIND